MEPRYPALLVNEDGSIFVLSDDAQWRDDLDLWYWCDPLDFLVDRQGLRFDQVTTRAGDGKPEQPPTWQLNRQLSLEELKQLCRQHFSAGRSNVSQLMEPIEKISGDDAPKKIIAYLQSLEPPAGINADSGFKPKTWWQYGLFGSLILFVMTFFNFLKAIPDLLQGNTPWHELPLFTIQVLGIGFVCGLTVWAVRPLWLYFGTLGDMLTGVIVLDMMFLVCMLIFRPEMFWEEPSAAAFMFLFGALAGAFGGYIFGKDIRKDAAVTPVDDDPLDNPFRR